MAGRRLVPLLLGACAAPSLPEGVDLEVVEGCVVLPGDVQAAEVVNALEGVPVVDGCFRLHVRTEGPMLALAVDADQIPVRMGWISPDRPDLDARLTAEALGWLAVGGPGAGLEASPTLHALLAADDRLDPVAEALDLALVEGGSAAYSARLPGVASALSVAAWAMLTEKPSEDPEAQRNAVLVDPGGPQSGLTVTQDAGVNQVSVVNTFRRGGAIFIDRVSTFDERGEETAAPLAVADVELRSVQALTGGLDAVAQLMAAAVQPGGVQGSEDVAYVPRTHGPFQLDPVPDARKTRYRVAVVGPGFSAGALPDLTPAQQTRQLDASVAFIAREYVLPLILQVVVPSASLNDRTDTALAEAITQDLVRLIGSQLPTVGPQVAGGDAVGALGTVWNALATSPTVRDGLFAILAERFYDYTTDAATAGTRRAGALATGFANVTGAVDAFLTTGDATFLARSLAGSNQADVWTVDVTESTVRFAPRSATVSPGDTVRLEVNVLDAPDDAALEYRFSTTATAGSLANDLHDGDTITSSQGWIDYEAGEEEGADVVEVEVYDIRLSDRVFLGDATARVEVTDTCDPEPVPTVKHTAFTQTSISENCANGPCHHRAASLLLRFAVVPGATRYVVAEGSTGSGNFQPGWEIAPFIKGKAGQSYYTRAEAEQEVPGYDQTPPLADEERLFVVSRMDSDWIRDGDPSTLEQWNEWVAEWTGRMAQVSIALRPVCDP